MGIVPTCDEGANKSLKYICTYVCLKNLHLAAVPNNNSTHPLFILIRLMSIVYLFKIMFLKLNILVFQSVKTLGVPTLFIQQFSQKRCMIEIKFLNKM